MSTAEAERPQDDYALGRSPQEYERLRAQARVWASATGRLFDQVGLASGARCLDAGCGPASATLSEIARDAQRFPDRPALWPLMLGAWKRKPHASPTPAGR